jgi:hypothetical protein
MEEVEEELGTGGGPFIVLSEIALPHWFGSDEATDGVPRIAEFRWDGPGSPATDYDRACDVVLLEREIGRIEVGPHTGVVINYETGSAVLRKGAQGELLIVCVRISDVEYEAYIDNWDAGTLTEVAEYTSPGGTHYIMDSAFAGGDVYEYISPDSFYLRFILAEGNYGVEAWEFRDVSGYATRIFRFDKKE